MKNLDNGSATSLTLLVHWEAGQASQATEAPLSRIKGVLIVWSFAYSSKMRPIVEMTPLLLDEESVCG